MTDSKPVDGSSILPSFATGSPEYHRARYERFKEALIGYLGGVCATCGATQGLEFDHIDPATKAFSIMSRWTRGVEALRPELDKCQLLCIDCHKAKSAASRAVVHGGGKSGKRRCRCDECRLAKNAYMRAYKQRKRNGK